MKVTTKEVNNETWHYVIPHSIIEEFLCSHTLTIVFDYNHRDVNKYSDLGNKKVWEKFQSKINKLLKKLEVL